MVDRRLLLQRRRLPLQFVPFGHALREALGVLPGLRRRLHEFPRGGPHSQEQFLDIGDQRYGHPRRQRIPRPVQELLEAVSGLDHRGPKTLRHPIRNRTNVASRHPRPARVGGDHRRLRTSVQLRNRFPRAFHEPAQRQPPERAHQLSRPRRNGSHRLPCLSGLGFGLFCARLRCGHSLANASELLGPGVDLGCRIVRDRPPEYRLDLNEDGIALGVTRREVCFATLQVLAGGVEVPLAGDEVPIGLAPSGLGSLAHRVGRLQHPDGFIEPPSVDLRDGLQRSLAHRAGIAHELPAHQRRHLVRRVDPVVFPLRPRRGRFGPLEGGPRFGRGTTSLFQGGRSRLRQGSNLRECHLRCRDPAVHPPQLFQRGPQRRQ